MSPADADVPAVSKEYSGEITLIDNVTFGDGSTVVFEDGTTVNLGTYHISIGSDSTVKFKGTVTFTSDGGYIEIGSGSTVSFVTTDLLSLGSTSFQLGDRTVTLTMDGSLALSYDYGLTSSTISAKYTRDGGDLVLTTSTDDGSEICTFDSLSLVYKSTPGGQKALNEYLSGSATFEEMIKLFVAQDSVSVDMDFGQFSFESRSDSASGYSYSRLSMISTASGTDLSFTLSSLGLTVGTFDVERVTVSKGDSWSDEKIVISASGFTDPKISISSGPTVSISFGADSAEVDKVNGETVSGVRMSAVKLNFSATLSADSVLDLSSISVLKWNADFEAGTATVSIAGKYTVSMTNVTLSAYFKNGEFTELKFGATLYDEKLTVDARGFYLEYTELDTGDYDVTITTDIITISYGRYTVALDTVALTFKNLNIDVLLGLYLVDGKIGIQDLIDSSDSVVLTADKITVTSGSTAEMDGVSITLSTGTDGWGEILIELGSAAGSLDTDDGNVEFEFSPTTISVRSKGSLSSVFDALLGAYTFTADTTAVFNIDTEGMTIKAITAGSGKTVVTEISLVPDSGTVTLSLEAVYTKADGSLAITSNLDLAGAILSVSVTTLEDGSGSPAVAKFSVYNATGDFQMVISVSGSDTVFTVSSTMNADSDLSFYYCGITCDFSATGSKITLSPLVFTLRGYDCSDSGIIPALSAIGTHDFCISLNGTVEASKLSLDTVTSAVAEYTDASIRMKDVSVDLKRGDSLSLVLGEVSISAKDSQGNDIDKTITDFHFTKYFSSSDSVSDATLHILMAVLIIAIALVWCFASYEHGVRAERARSRKD